VLEIIQTPDDAQSFALIRRHPGLDGRMAETVLSRWPTKNSAFDALYAELHAILVPRRSRRLERAVTMGGSIAAILSLALVALIGGAWLDTSTATADGGIERTAAPASYAITLDH
jgi:hypothetical protein